MMNLVWPKRSDGGQAEPASRNADKTGSEKAKSDHVFGQARKRPKMLRAGLYARVSTNNQQTLAMQNRAMREHPRATSGRYQQVRDCPASAGGPHVGAPHLNI
jgi:hypothetical protein